MKINKLFLLGLAGLAFTACSSDEEMTTQSGLPIGNGAVSVKIVNPASTRAITSPTGGDNGSKIEVSGTLTVTLSYKDELNQDKTQTLSIDAADLNNETKLKFWNIYKPEKLTVAINGGTADYSAVDISSEAMQNAPANIAAYGETGTFTKTTETGSPVIANDGITEEGAENGDDSKVYQMYNASVTMAIPVARLEVSGITHVTHVGAPDDVCEYAKLTIAGAYLDDLCQYGGKYSNGAYSAATTVGDYCWLENQGLGTGATAILKDAITGDETARNFLTGTWPANGEAFAYNFYASGTNPIFKIYFDQSEGASITEPRPAPRFAMVTKYVDADDNPVTFENGKIYRITKAELSDKNIIGDEGGNTLYGVTVTVTEAEWSIVDINAEWAE